MTINTYSFFSKFLHWGVALFFVAAYLSGEDVPFFIHLIAGLGFFIFLLTKVSWLFVSNDLANIRAYNFSGLGEFFKQLSQKTKPEQNHNPLSSIVSIGILFLGFCSVASGLFLLFDKEFLFLYGHNLKEAHEIFTTLTLLLVIVHLAGVIADKVIFGHETYKKMVSGEFKLDSRAIYGGLTLVLLASGAFWIYGIFSAEKQYAKNDLYIKECASCHFAYPADLYDKRSWENIMSNLDIHYGDSAELDEDTRTKINAYLATFSQSEKSKFYFGDFVVDGKYGSIVKTERFKKVHHDLGKEKVKPSCDKCHQDASSSSFRLVNIKIKEEADAKNSFDRR